MAEACLLGLAVACDDCPPQDPMSGLTISGHALAADTSEAKPATIPVDCNAAETACAIASDGPCWPITVAWTPDCRPAAFQLYAQGSVIFPLPPVSPHAELRSGTTLGLPVDGAVYEAKLWVSGSQYESEWLVFACDQAGH